MDGNPFIEGMFGTSQIPTVIAFQGLPVCPEKLGGRREVPIAGVFNVLRPRFLDSNTRLKACDLTGNRTLEPRMILPALLVVFDDSGAKSAAEGVETIFEGATALVVLEPGRRQDGQTSRYPWVSPEPPNVNRDTLRLLDPPSEMTETRSSGIATKRLHSMMAVAECGVGGASTETALDLRLRKGLMGGG